MNEQELNQRTMHAGARFGCFFVVLAVVLNQIGNTNGFFQRYEKDLLELLLTNYSTSYRPTRSNQEPINIEFDFKLNKIVKLDIKEQVLIVNSKITFKWRDQQLTWDPNKWNKTNYLNVASKYLWTPDIMLTNTAEDTSQSPSDLYKAMTLVTHKGDVIWTSPVTLKSSCEIDIKWFPFDTQKCMLTFGSLSYAKSRLQLRFTKKPSSALGIRGSTHYSSGDWTMKTLISTIREEKFECCPEKYSLIEYTFTLKRMFTYYLIYLVLPCLCLIFMAPCMFYIPADSGERLGFGVTIVLALSVYLLVISDKLPEKSDKTPLLGMLYTVMFFLLVLSLVAGIITTHLSYKISPPPEWLWKLLFKRKVEIKTTITINVANTAKEEVEMPPVRPGSASRSVTGLPPMDEEAKNQQKWKNIVIKLDKIMLYVYLGLAIVVPAIVCIVFVASD